MKLCDVTYFAKAALKFLQGNKRQRGRQRKKKRARIRWIVCTYITMKKVHLLWFSARFSTVLFTFSIFPFFFPFSYSPFLPVSPYSFSSPSSSSSLSSTLPIQTDFISTWEQNNSNRKNDKNFSNNAWVICWETEQRCSLFFFYSPYTNIYWLPYRYTQTLSIFLSVSLSLSVSISPLHFSPSYSQFLHFELMLLLLL